MLDNIKGKIAGYINMKCIIFDCDNVLVDSEIITTKYLIKHLHDIDFQISIEDAIKRFTGISVAVMDIE